MRKIVETRSLLTNTIKDTSTIMRNPLSEYVGRVTHDCASILDSIGKKTFVSTIFRMVHPYITVHSVELFLHLFNVFL